jgi:hypothetical protein
MHIAFTFTGASIELGQMDSASSPLAVRGLYRGRHRQWRRGGRKKVHELRGLVAVFTLALQFFTGLYLFVLPYVAKWRTGQRTG